ncbi:MAG: hypothetical protein OEW24_09180 [Chloroflexota bacterium]|nr:hypothetical protein [Chloroflexota bacterium]
MLESRSRSTAWLAVLAIVVLGCARDPVSTEVAAPGEAARVVWTEAGAAGGTPYQTETHIDSASGRYTIRTCGRGSTPCPILRLERESTVLPGMLRDVFAATTRPAFRALRANYEDPSGVLPPDGGGATIEVVRNGTRRKVSWTFNATVPTALADFQCLLRAARGDLVLCD